MPISPTGSTAVIHTLTIVKVDILGDFVPCTVVEMPDLLLVLHHAGGLAFLLILQSNIVPNGFKIFPVLEDEATLTDLWTAWGSF